MTKNVKTIKDDNNVSEAIKIMKNYKIAVVTVLILLLGSFSVQAQEKISAAVAANYIAAFKELATDFPDFDTFRANNE